MSVWSEANGRAVVYARSGGLCEVCRRPAASVHHRVKRGQGGTWNPANLLHLCGDGTMWCHGWIEGHPQHALALGLWLLNGTDPLTRPAYLHPWMWWRGWWFLHEDGCVEWTEPAPEPAVLGPAIAALTAARLTL